MQNKNTKDDVRCCHQKHVQHDLQRWNTRACDLVTIKFKYMPIVIAWEDATRSANRMHI